MPGGNKKVTQVTFLLPPGIKGLTDNLIARMLSGTSSTRTKFTRT